MSWIRRRATYDRASILDAAARARARKKRPRAIELYRRVLAVEPHNAEIHAKLAPLLAETRQGFDAWQSFRAVARAHLREGHVDQALAVYREAALYLPHEIQAWHAVARLQHRAGRQREAMETLFEASRSFRTRWQRPQAVSLLRRAREIEPWEFEIVLELARLLAADDQGHEADLLFDGLVERSQGDRLRRIRAAQLRHRPGPRTFWRWLRSALRRSTHDATLEGSALLRPDPEVRSSSVVQLHAARRG
jgi:tetratricopeptide (TPR) repeat protein